MTVTSPSTVSKEQFIALWNDLANCAVENERYFCDLDGVVGDGDFGMSLAKGFRQILADWETLPKDSISEFLRGCSLIIVEYCGGATGPLWSGAFRAAAREAKELDALSVEAAGNLLQASAESLMKRGGASQGDKTLLDALIPAAEALQVNKDKPLNEAITLAADAAESGAEYTKKLSAKKGRAAYAGDRSLSHPDAGAVAIGVLFKRAEKFING